LNYLRIPFFFLFSNHYIYTIITAPKREYFGVVFATISKLLLQLSALEAPHPIVY
jgi:hypothetical protein